MPKISNKIRKKKLRQINLFIIFADTIFITEMKDEVNLLTSQLGRLRVNWLVELWETCEGGEMKHKNHEVTRNSSGRRQEKGQQGSRKIKETEGVREKDQEKKRNGEEGNRVRGEREMGGQRTESEERGKGRENR